MLSATLSEVQTLRLMTDQALHIREAVHVLLNDAVLAAFQLALDLPQFEAEAQSIVREASHTISTLLQRLDALEAEKAKGTSREAALHAVSREAQRKSLELLGALQALRSVA